MNRVVKRNVLALLTCLMWSTAFCGTRYIGGVLSSTAITVVRVISAALLLLVIWGIRKDRKAPSLRDLPWFVLSGATGFGVYLILFSQGLKTITSAESSVILAMTPVIVAVFSTVIFRERLGLMGWLTTIGAFFGVAVLMLWGSGFHIQVGVFWTGAAATLFAVYNLTNRVLGPKGYSSIDIVTFSVFLSVLMLIWALPQTVHEISTAPVSTIVVAVLMGFVPSAAAYAVWGRALSLADKTSEVTNYMFVTPLFATIEGILFLNEIPDAGTYIGGGIIIVMVVLFNLTRKQA